MQKSIQPKDWDGNFSIVETKAGSGIYKIKSSPTGRFTAATLGEAIETIQKAKAKLQGWSVWLDGNFAAKLEKGDVVTPAKLAAICKEADAAQLAFVKRPFPQPKIRFIKGDGAAITAKLKGPAPKEL